MKMYIIRMDPSRVYGTGRGDAVIDYIEVNYNNGAPCGRFRNVKDASIMAKTAAYVSGQPVEIKAHYLDGSVGVGVYRSGERFNVPGRPVESLKKEIAEKVTG